MLIFQERSPNYFCHKEKPIACCTWDDGNKHQSSFIIDAITLIARGQLVWVESKEVMTTSWHLIQFVNRYDQVAYCCYTLIDMSDHEICAPLQMEKYFQILSLDLCLTKLTEWKSLTSIHANPRVRWCVKLWWVGVYFHSTNSGSSLTPHSYRAMIREERKIVVVHIRSQCI